MYGPGGISLSPAAWSLTAWWERAWRLLRARLIDSCDRLHFMVLESIGFKISWSIDMSGEIRPQCSFILFFLVLAFMQLGMAIGGCCTHWRDHQCSIQQLLSQVLCERRPSFLSIFMRILLVSLLFLWNYFTDLSYKCFFKSLQNLAQMGKVSTVPKDLMLYF